MLADEKKINDASKGCLYSFSEKKGLIEEDRDYLIPNGPVVSADNNWMYHCDSLRGIIFRYRYNKQHLSQKSKEIFLDCNEISSYKPSPDGMTFDKNNNLVVAMWGLGEVWYISPDASLLHKIKIPAKNVTNVCFRGALKQKLLVTYARSESSYGGIYEVPNYNF